MTADVIVLAVRVNLDALFASVVARLVFQPIEVGCRAIVRPYPFVVSLADANPFSELVCIDYVVATADGVGREREIEFGSRTNACDLQQEASLLATQYH